MPPQEVAISVCQVRTSLLIVQSSEAQKNNLCSHAPFRQIFFFLNLRYENVSDESSVMIITLKWIAEKYPAETTVQSIITIR